MTIYENLLAETAAARTEFLSVPLLQRALREGVGREIYLAYLEQAFHHVRLGVPLLALGAAHAREEVLRYGLYEYVEEEKGHEHWILEDIEALGGDVAAVARGQGNTPCRAMIGYVHYAVEHISPWSVLGLSHVLENTAVSIAGAAASKIRASVGSGAGGFKYLTTHGAVDQDHVVFFEKLVNHIANEADAKALFDTASVVYRLFGDMFRDIDASTGTTSKLLEVA